MFTYPSEHQCRFRVRESRKNAPSRVAHGGRSTVSKPAFPQRLQIRVANVEVHTITRTPGGNFCGYTISSATVMSLTPVFGQHDRSELIPNPAVADAVRREANPLDGFLVVVDLLVVVAMKSRLHA